jgi:hypothetical protein
MRTNADTTHRSRKVAQAYSGPCGHFHLGSAWILLELLGTARECEL